MPKRFLPLLIALLFAGPSPAAEWEPVLRDRARAVELDRASVLQSDPGTKVAWARIVLGGEEAASNGYASVKALNRYDCNARSFYTIKRVYLDGENNMIRDERVADQRPIPVEPSSVDERLWREVCKPPAAKDLKKVAEEAGRAAAAAAVKKEVAAEPKPETKSLRRADFHPDAKAERAELDRASESASPPAAEARGAPAQSEPAPARDIAKPIAPLVLPPPPPKPEPAPAAVKPAPEPLPAAKAAARHMATPVPAARPRPSGLAKAEEPERVALVHPAPSPTKAAVAHRDIHWSYEGESGPENWARMNPEWAKCASGQRQSPIDIRDGIRVDQTPLRFDYRSGAARIVDNGHTVQMIPGDGNVLLAQGRRFELVQMHFHRPSEERIDGRAFDMVAHLVHRDQDGRLGVVAVLMEVGSQPNPLLQTLWNNLPLEKRIEGGLPETVDLTQLLPASSDYYAYMGSLTTPPCSEDVLWLVLRQPVQISEDQLRVFARLYPRNIRPIQRLNDRLIKESR